VSEFDTRNGQSGLPRWALALGFGVFTVGLILALQAVRIEMSDVSIWWMAAAALVGVPMMTAANAMEYKLTAQLSGHSVSVLDAVEVAITSTAANVLPLPGGPLVKIASLRRAGSTTSAATRVTIWAGLLWLAVASVVAALALLSENKTIPVIVGLGSLAMGAVAVTRLVALGAGTGPQTTVAGLVSVEVAGTLATALRLWLVAQAIGISLGSTAFVLALAPVLGAAVVFVPAGLGVRESASAGLAVVSGATAGVGFLVAAVDRILGLVVHGIAAGLLLTRRKRTMAS